MNRRTKNGGNRIPQAARQSGAENMGLRIAAKLNDAGDVEFGLGFDDERDNDTITESYGVTLLVHASSAPYLQDITIDYVESAGSEPHFVFMLPEQHGDQAKGDDAQQDGGGAN